MIKKYLFGSTLLAVLFLAACSEYNNTKYTDKNNNDARIYGNIDGPPKQLGTKYNPDTTSAKRVNMIREKLYPKK